MVIGVIIATLGLLIFRAVVQKAYAFWGGVAGGVANGIAIYLLDKLYSIIARKLNDWEKHRTATEYEDALIIKTFFFSFVNSYCSLFYIAFFKGHSTLFGRADDCILFDGEPNCMVELSTQLQSIFLTRLAIGNFTEVVLPWATAKYVLWKQTKDTSKIFSRGDGDLDPAQAEATLQEYSTDLVSGTFGDYAELAIQFGYVVLFAPAFPLAPAIALLSNIFETGTDGYKILLEYKRPVYQGAANIGPWLQIFYFLCILAVITNSLIIGFTSRNLDKIIKSDSEESKWLFVVATEHSVFAVLYLFNLLFNAEPRWVRVEKQRLQKIEEIELVYESTLSKRRLSVMGAKREDKPKPKQDFSDLQLDEADLAHREDIAKNETELEAIKVAVEEHAAEKKEDGDVITPMSPSDIPLVSHEPRSSSSGDDARS